MKIIPIENVTLLNNFIDFYSDGFITNHISLSANNEYHLIFGELGVVAVGFIRGWDEGWDYKCLGLIVHSGYRGKGYGSLMLHFLETVARERGETKLRLHVQPSNHKARRMYERHFWYPYGRRENGEIIYFKNLCNSGSRV